MHCRSVVDGRNATLEDTWLSGRAFAPGPISRQGAWNPKRSQASTLSTPHCMATPAWGWYPILESSGINNLTPSAIAALTSVCRWAVVEGDRATPNEFAVAQLVAGALGLESSHTASVERSGE